MRKITIILFPLLTLLIANPLFYIMPISAQINSIENITDDITTSVNTKNLTLLNDNQVNEKETTNANSSIFKKVDSKINISLSQAADIAEKFIGNNSSRAVMSQLDEYNGYLVYVVCIMDPSMNLTHVYIDPGDGKIVNTQNSTINEALMMHGNIFMG